MVVVFYVVLQDMLQDLILPMKILLRNFLDLIFIKTGAVRFIMPWET